MTDGWHLMSSQPERKKGPVKSTKPFQFTIGGSY